MGFLCAHVTTEQSETFVSPGKGKFIEKLNGKFTDKFRKSNEAMNEAVASKYHLHLSRRKYTFLCKVQAVASKYHLRLSRRKYTSLCKVQDKTFDTQYHMVIRIFPSQKAISDVSVEKIVKGLNIGEIHMVPGLCGAVRLVANITTMRIDLHLQTESLCKKLVWYNGNENHFIIEFSDDGDANQKMRQCALVH